MTKLLVLVTLVKTNQIKKMFSKIHNEYDCKPDIK